MVRTKAAGVHKVNARLADGTRKTYYYAWRGGPRINAEPDTREFMAEYVRLTRARADGPFEGCVAELVRDFAQSSAWTKLKPSTRDSYMFAIDRIETEFADWPVKDLNRKGVRKMLLDWRDEMAKDTPRMADMTISVFQKILSFAVDREYIASHPLERVSKVTDNSRRDIIWTPEQIDRFKAHAPAHMIRALMLAMWTGQRQGDLLALTWKAYDGESIALKQGKTGAWVRVLVSRELKAELDKAPKTAVTILTNAQGLPWKSGFKSSWRKAVEAAGIEDAPHFHDLRGTFVTLAYRRGSSIRDIAEITGHSEKDAERIIRKHYLVSRKAVEAIEQGTEM